jgi:Replication initiator protein A
MPANGAQELRLFENGGGPIIQVEINLEEAPLFMIRRKDEDSDAQTIEARNIALTRNGDRLEQYWKVTAHRDFGLPGAVEEAVFIAVMKLVSMRGGMPPDGRISFSLYELMKLLGKSRGANNYERLREALDRLGETSIYAENAFYSKADGDFRSYRFHLWDVFFAKKTRGNRQTEHHTLKFTDVLVSSFNAGYLKDLDSDFYHSLNRDLARSLYRLIDVKRDGKLSWSVDLQRLRQMVSMPPSYKYASKIKEKLVPANKELIDRGFLDRADIEERGSGRAKVHVVHYRVSPAFVRKRTDPAADLSEPERYAVDNLCAHGVWPERARKLVVEHGADHCLYYVELLPYQREVRKPAAWLVKFIEKGWPVPVPNDLTLPSMDDAGSGDEQRPRLPESDNDAEADTNLAPRDPEAREIFAAILDDLNLSESGHSSSTRVQFDEGLATSLDASCLTLTVPVRSARDYIDSHLRPRMEAALRRRLGEYAILRVVCPPEAGSTDAKLTREFEFRRRAGEFERAIETFETLPYEEYRQWVGQEPLHPDGNHYYLSLDGKLFVCVGGRGPDYRHFLCTLDRANVQ